ncbi:FAD:protein FMN transferase [Shimia sp. W99]
MSVLNRRHFLTIAAASVALPAGAATLTTATWRGQALGATTYMKIAGLGDTEAAPIFAHVEQELVRLERIFSLYRDSALVALNRDGQLDAPAPELLEVLSLADGLHRASGGVFDPSIQPKWRAMAGQGADGPVGWSRVRFDARKVVLEPGMALTLNGIAQGFVTDRITALLRNEGLRDVLMDMGEIAAMGARADGTPWKAGVATPQGEVIARLTLKDRALATSAVRGTVLGDQGHILHPAGKDPHRALVSVSAPRAVIADGLSTALCLMSEDAGAALVSQYAGARIEASV